MNIVDDVPTVESFKHEVTEGDTNSIEGNALEGAVAGADGAEFAWDADQQGQYGTITLNPDGTYSYKLNNDNPAVKELTDGKTLTEKFTYTYTDADGDVATGSVTITINGVDNEVVVKPSDPEAGSDNLTVHESGLADGSEPGVKPTTASGSLDIDAPDGVKSITLQFGDKRVEVSLDGTETTLDMHGEGSLTASYADGKLSYTYTLGDNTLEHGPGNNEANDISHEVTVTVTDMDNSEASGTITVNIVDDVPTIVHDKTTSLVPGDAPFIISKGTVTVDPGADGFASDYQNIHAKFDLDSMVDEGSLSDDGMSGTIIVLIDGIEKQVTVKLSENSDKSILTGTIEGSSDPLFEATLDKEGNWSMEQYEQFHMPSDDGSSNKFELVFKTADGDGDVATTTVNVPLEVKSQEANNSGDAIGNGDDTIIITGGDGVAGTVAAGDSGGMTEGQQVEANYNVCFILDTSGSMGETIDGRWGSQSRLDVAVESIQNFVRSSIHEGDFVGTVNLAVVSFANSSSERNIIEVSISRESDGHGGYTETYTLGDRSYPSYDSFIRAFSNRLSWLDADGGTNYEAGFRNAADWFDGLGDTSEADGNITYFLTDGVPTYHGTNSYGGRDHATKDDVEGAWDGYQDLLGSAANMQVNAIGFGDDLSDEAMKTLAMLDNTGTTVSGADKNVEADGKLYYGNSGKNPWQPTEEVYTSYEGTPPSWHDGNTYYTQIDGSYQKLEWDYQNGKMELGYYTGSLWSRQWHSVNDDLYTMQEVPVTTGGNATRVTDGDSLTAAFESGFKPGALVGVGDDIITAASSSSSVIVYGDVMNTDMLLNNLNGVGDNIEAALVAAGIGFGSGSKVFQWLENEGNAYLLTGTKYEGWSHSDTLKYMLEHSAELGYETRMDESGNFYLVDASGNVLNMDGTSTHVSLDDLTGRTGGDDVITGSGADDFIFGQEGDDIISGGLGNDTLYGGTGDDILFGDEDKLSVIRSVLGISEENDDPDIIGAIKDTANNKDALTQLIDAVEGAGNGGDDQLFGGSGDDLLFGMGGNDYLSGGEGEDFLFGGSGNDIIVYDENDYLVDGGSGIDFMVSDDNTLTLDGILSNKDTGTGPLVNSIEVLITGEKALDLTNINQLAEKYGITLGENADGKETLSLDMSKWTQEGDNTYTLKEGGLTLETNLERDMDGQDDAQIQQHMFILQNGQGS